MFTGIVEELGLLKAIRHYQGYTQLQVQASKVLQDLQLGDSIAINGVCQTVEKFDRDSFTVAAFKETLTKTNLGQLQTGALLHLERALTLATRIGGHIVQGHVDGLAYVHEVRKEGNNYYLHVKLPSKLMNLCILHGSICLDGVSLTIAKLYKDGLEANIIAHTWQHTIFGHYRIGTAINVECDMFGKYILRFAQNGLLNGNHFVET